MAKNPISRLHELSATMDEHLHQFMNEGSYEDDVSRREKKRKNPVVRAGMAGGGVAGAAALAYNKDKIKAGAMDAVRRGKAPAARMVEGAGAKVSNAGIDAASRLRKSRAGAKVAGAVESGAVKAGNKILKGAKRLRKLAFSRADMAAIVRIESKIRAAGA